MLLRNIISSPEDFKKLCGPRKSSSFVSSSYAGMRHPPSPGQSPELVSSCIQLLTSGSTIVISFRRALKPLVGRIHPKHSIRELHVGDAKVMQPKPRCACTKGRDGHSLQLGLYELEEVKYIQKWLEQDFVCFVQPCLFPRLFFHPRLVTPLLITRIFPADEGSMRSCDSFGSSTLAPRVGRATGVV